MIHWECDDSLLRVVVWGVVSCVRLPLRWTGKEFMAKRHTNFPLGFHQPSVTSLCSSSLWNLNHMGQMTNLWTLYPNIFFMQFYPLIYLLFNCSLFKEKKSDTLFCHWLSLAVFHNFDATLPAVFFLDGMNLNVHFEFGPLNTRGDAMPRTSQWWHLTDIHQLRQRQRWLTGGSPWILLLRREKVLQFHCHFLTETQGIKSFEGMPRRMRGFEHPRGRYSLQPSCVFSHALQTPQWLFFDLWESRLRFTGHDNRCQW